MYTKHIQTRTPIHVHTHTHCTCTHTYCTCTHTHTYTHTHMWEEKSHVLPEFLHAPFRLVDPFMCFVHEGFKFYFSVQREI